MPEHDFPTTPPPNHLSGADLLYELQNVRASADCPESEVLDGYADGTLWRRDPDDARVVRYHIRRCPVCRYDVHRILEDLPLRYRWLALWRLWSPGPAQVWKYAVAALVGALLPSLLLVQVRQRHAALERTVIRQSGALGVFGGVATNVRAETDQRLKTLETRIPEILNTGTLNSLQVWGSVFMYGEQFREAIGLYERAKQLRPAYDEPYQALASIYKITGEHNKAIENLEALLVLQPGDHDTLNYLGWLYFVGGAFDRARACYTRALTIQADDADARFNLALLEEREGNAAEYTRLTTEAKSLLLRQISLYPEAAVSYFTLAKINAHEKNWQQATDYLKTSIGTRSIVGILGALRDVL